MPKQMSEDEIRKLLDPLRPTPARNPLAAESARQRYLAQVSRAASQGVSLSLFERLKQRRNAQNSVFPQRKETKPMFTTIVTILSIVALALGGGGITIAAAQTSMPDDALYGVKLWSEDAMLWFNTDPAAEWQMALEFAERRTEEVRAMLDEGKAPDDALQTRLTQQTENALRLASALPGEEAVDALSQVKTRLTQENQLMEQIHAQDPALDAAILRIREILRIRLNQALEGVEDPGQLFIKLQEQNRQVTQSAGKGEGGNADWMVPTAIPEPPVEEPLTETVTEPVPGAQSGAGPNYGPNYAGARLIVETTTFQELLDWGISQASIESILGSALPDPSLVIIDYLKAQGLDYSAIYSALKSLVHQTVMPIQNQGTQPGSGGGNGSGGRK